MAACGPGLASGGTDTGTGESSGELPSSSESGEPAETSESGEPPTDLPPESDLPPEACWTTTRTGYDLSAIHVDAGGIIAASREELWIEQDGEFEIVAFNEPLEGSFTGMVGEPDDLWLWASNRLSHWDGATLELVEEEGDHELIETPGGTVLHMSWEGAGSPISVEVWVDGAWQATPELADGGQWPAIAADDHALWVLARGDMEPSRLYRRGLDEPWAEVELPPSWGYGSIVADEAGGLYMLSGSNCNDPLQLAHLDGGGQAIVADLPVLLASGTCAAYLHGFDGQALIRATNVNDVWAWSGAGEPSIVGQLDNNLRLVASHGGRLVAANDWTGIEIFELDFEAPAPITTLLSMPSFRPSGGGAGASSGTSPTHALSPGYFYTVMAWDGLGWTVVDELGPSYGVSSIWAESPSRAWLVRGAAPGQPGSEPELLRWDADAGPTSWSLGPELRYVWGRGPGEVWAAAGTELLRWDGEAWALAHTFDAPILAVHGAAEVPSGPVFVVTADAYTWRVEDGELEVLGSFEVEPTRAVLAAGEGEQLFARVRYLLGGGAGHVDEVYYWDGQSWVEVEQRWPEFGWVRSVISDGASVFAHVANYELDNVYTYVHWDGEAWLDIGHPATDSASAYDRQFVSASAEGLVAMDDRNTYVFRWDCG